MLSAGTQTLEHDVHCTSGRVRVGLVGQRVDLQGHQVGDIARIDIGAQISIGLCLSGHRYDVLGDAGADRGELRVAVVFVVQGGFESGS